MLTSLTLVMYKILMCDAIPILTYLQLSYLLAQLIYARIKSPQKGLFLFHRTWNMSVLFSICFYQIHFNMANDSVMYYQNPDDGSKVNDREIQKNTHLKCKGQCKYKISTSKRFHIYYCTAMIAKQLTQTFILTCCRLTLLSVLQHYAYHQIIDFEIYTSPTTILQLNALFSLT